jgi:flagellin
MSEIVLSSAVRSNLLNLQSTAELLGKTQTRLATGKKVNSALDNPTNFFTASSLNSRAADLGRLLDSVSNAVQTIAAADKGISAITKLVESAQATARQALQTAATITANTPATVSGNIDLGNDTAAITTGTLNLGTDISAGNTGTTAVLAADLTSTVVSAGDTLAVTIGAGSTFTLSFNSGGANTGADIDIANVANDTVGELVAVMQARIRAGAGVDAGSANVNITAGNRIHIDTGLTTNRSLTLVDNTSGSTTNGFGLTNGTYQDTNTAIGALAGSSLSVTVGSTVTNLTFGLGAAGVSNRTELTSLLGATSSITGGNFLQIQAANLTDAITVSGSAAATLGIASAEPTSAAIQALTGTVDVSLNGGTAVSVNLASLNNESDLDDAFTAAGLSAEVDATSGFLELTAVNGTDTFALSNGTGSVQQLGSNLVSGTTVNPTLGTPNPKRDELRVQYNELLDQIDQLTKDSGFNGVNLLNGDNLSVLFNEDGTSKLDLTGVSYSALGLGLADLVATDFDTNAGINATLDDLKAATDTLRTQSSKFGSNLSVVEARQDFTKEMINVLETGAANLTLADSNEEAANLLALQTRQQLSSTALSLASQADQNVLRLF